MGGIGSGRRERWGKKTSTEEVPWIDIRYLRKQGILRPGYASRLTWSRRNGPIGSIFIRVARDHLRLMYHHQSRGEGQQTIEERVPLDQTPCNYGGERQWFLCPHCRKRVAILYCPSDRFLCRHCYGLPYASKNENHTDRMLRKVWKIRARLGGSDNLTIPILQKPKGMHWKTFDRLLTEEKKVTQVYWIKEAEKVGIISKNNKEDTKPHKLRLSN
jgi:hypothetical protein